MTNEEAIKSLKKLKSYHNGSYGTAIDLAIKALEQTRWIPVEERNPDKTGVYLATIKYLNRDDEYCYMIVKRSYYANVGTWDDSLVIAWMPLPEPYREEDNVCKDCYYNDGDVHAECVVCDKVESEDKE